MPVQHTSPLLVTPVPRDGPLPVSFTQEERLSTGRYAEFVNNKIAVGLRFDGHLDTALLERAIALLVERHESLRMCFPLDPAGHVLRVLPCPEPSLRVVTLESAPPDQRLDRALAALAEDACRPFDLATGPLFRTLLARVDATTHVLCLTIDHAVIDAWSVRLMIADLLRLYTGLATDEPADLPELPVQFPDFAAWERRYLTGPTLDRLMGYWRTKLEGIDPIPASGLTDPAGAPGGRPHLAKATRTVSDEHTRELEGFPAEGASLTSVVGAAVKAAMWRRRCATMGDAEGGDVAVFASLANRTRPETEHMVGYLATVAALRTRFDGSVILRDLVTRVGRTIWEAMRHQRIPHSLIMSELGHEQYGARYRDAAETPSYFNFDVLDYEVGGLRQPPGLRVDRVAIPMPDVPRGGLRFLAFRRAHGLTLEFRYRGDRYGTPWAEEFLTDVTALLDRLRHEPDTTVGRAFAHDATQHGRRG